MFRPALLCAVLAVAASACSDPEASPPPEREAGEEPSVYRPSPPVRPGVPLDDLLAPRIDDGAVLARFRPARAVRAEAEPNRHVEGQTDTVRTYVYDGMTVEAYEVTGGPTFIQSVRVTEGGYGTGSGVGVGTPRSDVEAAFGPPVHESGDGVEYETGGGETPTTVTVVYEPDRRGQPRAASITWRPYLD